MEFRLRKIQIAALVAFVLLLSCIGASARADVRSRIDEVTKGFKDIELDAKVKYSNTEELQKISKDLCTTYKLGKMSVRYKSPDKLRLDAKLGIVGISMVINGNEKGFRLPIRGWQKQNIKGKPHERQTDLDLGIVSDSLWRNYVVFGSETVKIAGSPAYKITFAWGNHRENKQICWIDAKTLSLLRLRRMDEDGKLIASYVYSDHKCVSGIWIPTKIEVFGGDGKLAGITEYSKIKVNAGIPESTFCM